MKITQVNADYVKEHLDDPSIYRLTVCDDGNYGHSHISARIKPLKSMTLDEFNKSIENENYGFIRIEVNPDV